jgi:signal transduction histidine kinase
MSTKPGLWGIETEAQQLASLMARSLPVTVASVALWDEPSLSLAVKAVTSLRPVDQSLPVGARVPLSDAQWHRTAFQRGEPVLVQGDRETGFRREAELALMPNLRSMYLVPIRFASDTVGVLGLGEMRAPEREPFSADKQQRCRAILDEFVAATAHAWEARRLRRQVRVMSSIMQLVRGVSTARSFEEILLSLTSEAADWLGAPVHGALLRISPNDVRLLAQWQLPDGGFEDGGRQLVLAMTRTVGQEAWPVSVTLVGDDPLDPLGAMDPGARKWTRLGVPLMRDDRLIGVACLYLEDEVRLTDWELEALRRRGEIAAIGVEAVEAARAYEREQECLHRTVLELLTGYRRTLLQEMLGGLHRALPALLRRRLREAVPGLAQPGGSGQPSEGDQPDLLGAVVAEVSAAVSQLWEGHDHPESATMPLDVNDVVVRALRIARMSLEELARRRGATVVVHFQPSAGPLPIEGSLALVGAIVHAIESAVEAMPEGGEIHVRTSRENDHAVIAIEDSGREPVLEVDGLARFSPNYHGLVLSIVRAIAHRHGGQLTLVRRQTQGKTLFVHLPLASGEAKR